ncbi:MAG TPA: glycosyltransferase family 4 protein [Planctomycetaceae bacterium]|nr:glycosyltransferase family 4 protein [Planctomycetaceae bacterium]
MRIALVKRRCSLRVGGSERYCVNLARRLQARGHDVTVIGEQIDDELRSELAFIPVRVNRLTSWTRNRSFAENCGRAVRGAGFDLVYGLGRSFGLDAVRVTERLQSHWLNVRYRNPMRRLLERFNPRHRTLIGLERQIYRSGNVRRVVTQSRLDRRLVVECYGVPEDKVRTIYNGVDTAVFHPGMRNDAADVREELGFGPDEPLLVFASMDFEGKGLRSILAAVARTRHRAARLLVLGRGPVRRFARIADDLGIGRRVIFAGRRGDIQRFYGAGDLFLLPTAYEPFPNVNLEALACGLPVLTTTTAGGADLIVPGENGYLVSGLDAADEIAACVDEHLSLPAAARQALSDRCWATARQWTIERNVEETLDMFQEVLREKSRS